MPDAGKVHPRLPHHVTGSSPHELIASQHDKRRIKFTKCSEPHHTGRRESANDPNVKNNKNHQRIKNDLKNHITDCTVCMFVILALCFPACGLSVK